MGDLAEPPARLVRLHGREGEARAVDGFLADPAVRVVLARGPAGAGKTALLEQHLARAAAAGALIGVGRHETGEANADLAPLLAALEQAVSLGLEQLYEPAAGLETLLASLDANASVFAGLGGGLLNGLAARAPALIMPAEAADERVVKAVTALLTWLEGFDQPILLLLDDWGRASPRARRIYRRLMLGAANSRLRWLVTERPDERFEPELDAGVAVVSVGPPGAAALMRVIGDRLGGEAGAAARAVLDFIDDERLLPFDLLQILGALHDGGALAVVDGQWRFDAAVAAGVLGDGVAQTVSRRLGAVSAPALRLARAMAVHRAPAAPSVLFVACDLSRTAGENALWALVDQGLARTRDGEAGLAHDRVAEAVRDGLDEMAYRRVAGDLANALRRTIHPADPAKTPSGVATDLTTMLSLHIRCWPSEEIRNTPLARDWAQLFSIGAERARSAGDQDRFVQFAERGLELATLADCVGHAVLTEAVLAAVQRADHDLAAARADQLVAIASTARERNEAEEVRIFAARMAGDLERAFLLGRQAAARVGLNVADRPSLAQVMVEVLRIRLADPKSALAAGPLSDADLAIVAPRLRVLMAVGSVLHERNMFQALIHGARAASGRMGSGTALGASVRAFICAMTGGYERAAQWAEVSDARQGPGQPNRAAAMQTAIYFGHWFTHPRAALATRTDETEAAAYAEGDLATAAYANRNRVLDHLFLGRSLVETARLADQGLTVAERLNDRSTRPVIAAVRQIAENLRGPAGQPRWRLDGAFFDASIISQRTGQPLAEVSNVQRPIAMLEVYLAVLCGAYAEAADIHDRRAWCFAGNPHNPQVGIWIFASALALYRCGRLPKAADLRLLRRLARLNPRDHAHRIGLLDAEKARCAGDAGETLRLYEQSFAASRASDCLLEQGLVARAAMEGAEGLGARAAAAGFRRAAESVWRELGATALSSSLDMDLDIDGADDLEGRFARLNGDYERRTMELAQARDAAERADRAKSRLLAAVGHELRTPLQGLAGLLELSKDAVEPLDTEALSGAVAQLTSVVGDLTDLGALDGGALSLGAEAFELRHLLATLATVHGPSLSGGGRTIVEPPPGPALWVVGDEGRLRQILSNLIGNAIKHGDGDVVLGLQFQPAGQDRAKVSVSVTDDGPGLSPADAVRLFEPFVRGAGADRIEGLGLGLSIARRLARAMGGDLSVQARPGEGATFRVDLILPLAAAAPAPSRAALEGLRVLVAEDTPLTRRVLSAMLRAEGCKVEVAADGQEALTLAGDQAFDLILLDMRMPLADGLIVAEALRRGPGPNRATPTAVITASRDERLDQAATPLGLLAVLQKPVSRTDLRRLLLRAAGAEPGLTEQAGPDEAVSPQARIQELRASLGQEATDQLLNDLGPGIELALAAIEAAAARQDSLEVSRQAHRLVGLARHFGLVEIGNAASALEAAAEAADEAAGAPASQLAEAIAQVGRSAAAVDWSRLSGPLNAPGAG